MESLAEENFPLPRSHCVFECRLVGRIEMLDFHRHITMPRTGHPVWKVKTTTATDSPITSLFIDWAVHCLNLHCGMAASSCRLMT
jgi:hypothetical protein